MTKCLRAKVEPSPIGFIDRINPAVFTQSVESLQPLIDKYCYPAGCPMCGRAVIKTTGEKFYGCINRPECQGFRSRGPGLPPVLNDALRFFLTEKARQETLKEEQKEFSRFRNLDL